MYRRADQVMLAPRASILPFRLSIAEIFLDVVFGLLANSTPRISAAFISQPDGQLVVANVSAVTLFVAAGNDTEARRDRMQRNKELFLSAVSTGTNEAGFA